MLKKSLLISSFAAMLLVGCGSSNNSSTTDTSDQVSTTQITVERGPVLGSLVLDANGSRAIYQGQGKYQFQNQIAYPISAQGGYIDVNRNNQVDAGEVKLQYTLQAEQGNVITMVTTIANSATLRTMIKEQYGLSDDEIDSQTPSQNRVIAAISDEMYAYCQDNNLTPLQLQDMDQDQLKDQIQDPIQDRIQLYRDSNQTVAQLEAALIEELGIETVTADQLQSASQQIDQSQLQDGTLIDHIPLSELTQTQIDDLIFMIEEEKMARDVYLYLYQTWQLKVFANIAKSEQKHMDAVQALLERYSLTIPSTLTQEGVYENADLQALYDQLVAKGDLSLTDALEVGVLIEETDIADLEAIIEAGVPEDLEIVYQNLLNGSLNHLNAFNNLL